MIEILTLLNVGVVDSRVGVGSHIEIREVAFNGERSTVVPVPAAVCLFGSGLMGLIGVARRKIS